MREPAKRAVLALVDDAHAEHRLCLPQSASQRRQLARGVEARILLRPYPGVYASAELWQKLSPQDRVLYAARALAKAHPTWVFAAETAAVAHGLRVSWRHLDTLCVARPHGSQIQSHGKMRFITVSNDTTEEHAGIRVTSFERTTCDCLRGMPFGDALALADSALALRPTTPARLAKAIGERFRRIPGLRRVRQIIALADGRSESGGESIARAQMIALGFAIPDLQRVIADPLNPYRQYRADFAWDLEGGGLLLGELDGREKYLNADMTHGRSIDEILLAERRREARLTLADSSVRVMRFSYAEVLDTQGFQQLLQAYGVPRAIVIPEVATVMPLRAVS